MRYIFITFHLILLYFSVAAHLQAQSPLKHQLTQGEFSHFFQNIYDHVGETRSVTAKNASYIPALRDKPSESLGFSVWFDGKLHNLGQTKETFTIQSIGKVFADATLRLTESAPQVNGIPVLRFPYVQRQTEVIRPINRAATIGSEYSPFLFGSRKNIIKIEENGSPKRYHIPNSSVNVGALATMGRIPDKALINGELVEGRFNIVKKVSENLLGRTVDIDHEVFQSELLATYRDRSRYLEEYYLRKKSLDVLRAAQFGSLEEYHAKKAVLKKNYDWEGLRHLERDLTKSEKIEPIDNLTRALLVKQKGFFGKQLSVHEVESIMTDYTKQSSMLVNTEDLATIGALIANGGIHPLSKERLLPDVIAKEIYQQMKDGGLYQQSNQQLAVKSGVGGGLMAAFPGYGGAGTLSRPLNLAGNSADGLRLLYTLDKQF